jgi:hypothetical protein
MNRLGHRVERPDAAGQSERSGALVEQVAQGFVKAGIQDRLGGFGPGGFGGEAAQALRREGVDGVTGRPIRAAEVAGDQTRGLPAGAGQQDLRAAEGEGIGGSQASLQLLPLGPAQGANKGGNGSHIAVFAARSVTERPSSSFH